MRNLLFLIIVFASCKIFSKNSDLDTIPGMYVRAINHEFATGSDTLVVALLDMQTGTFTIVKKSGFVQYLNGKPLGRQYKSEKYTVVYDELTGTLNDNHKMKTFTALPQKDLLLSGSTAYKRVITK